MRILLVNKYHYLKGGSEKYYFELGELLKSHGHDVAYFSMEDPKNISTGDKEYFVKSCDMNSKDITKALDVIYNKDNEKIMEYALCDFKPDIVHLNNFQRQLSASIIKPIKKRNIPIVFTAHDVQAICPAITMQDRFSKVCESCTGGKYYNCLMKKCIKNSTLKSLLGALEGCYYRINKIYSKDINTIVTPSDFVKNKFLNDGISNEKIKVLPNYVEINDYNVSTSDDGYAFFFGRLSKEKGVVNLVNAFSKCKYGKLYIAGEGPEKENILNIIKENGISDRVKLLGFLDKKNIIKNISRCKFVVIPSTCNENCPYSIIESFAVGKTVLATNIGGIPELVVDNQTGFLFENNNIVELAEKIDDLFVNDEKTNFINKNVKNIAKNKYSKEAYYNNIMKIYNDLIKENK